MKKKIKTKKVIARRVWVVADEKGKAYEVCLLKPTHIRSRQSLKIKQGNVFYTI